jgi:enoyl-CoA hydratase/carnithine racemase
MSADAGDGLVLLSHRGNGIYGLQLNRPARLNALDTATLRQLDDHIRTLSELRARAVVISGAGRVFCAGADIDELAAHSDPHSFSAYLRDMLAVFDALATAPFVTIAGIHGVALGGGLELALACDIRVLAEDASVGVPEVFLGALPGGGGIARLSHLLPAGVVREMVLLGRRLDAESCLRYGLARVSPSTSLREDCLALAAETPVAGAEAIALGKLLLASVAHERTGSQSQFSRAAISQLVLSPEFRQGVDSFLAARAK